MFNQAHAESAKAFMVMFTDIYFCLSDQCRVLVLLNCTLNTSKLHLSLGHILSSALNIIYAVSEISSYLLKYW